MFRNSVELTTAIIDLLTGLVVIPFLFIIRKKSNSTLSRKWNHFLACLALADIMGFIVHAFDVSELTFDIVWVFLYPSMFLLAIGFFNVITYVVIKDYDKKKRAINIILYVVAIILDVISSIFLFKTAKEEIDIRLFAIFAMIIDLPSFGLAIYEIIKRKRKSYKFMLTSLIPLLIGLPFELISVDVKPIFLTLNKDGIFHACLLISVIILSIAALKDIKEKEEN